MNSFRLCSVEFIIVWTSVEAFELLWFVQRRVAPAYPPYLAYQGPLYTTYATYHHNLPFTFSPRQSLGGTGAVLMLDLHFAKGSGTHTDTPNRKSTAIGNVRYRPRCLNFGPASWIRPWLLIQRTA
jgi:hypothetical protein